ncbi:MAG: hypothetical protein PWQ12_786 [Clostridiales bacterium]|jgi:pyruvate dehydrogenase E2 component (dihydrolipoamide acetyltransferase)|nr:hypothetical protein [Clostridiales bacterium]
MATEVIMPKAGMAMEEGTVVKWLKKEGETVEKGEPLLEIITDKVNMEIEAEISGTLLKILADEGEVLPVMTVIGYIGAPGEALPEEKNAPSTASETVVQSNPEAKAPVSGADLAADEATTGFEGGLRATPASRKLAREAGIALSRVAGTGPKGRIQKSDVEAYLADEGSAESTHVSALAKRISDAEGIDLSQVKGTGHAGKVMSRDVMNILDGTLSRQAEASDTVAANDSYVEPLSSVRKVIAKRMTESFFTAPTFTLNIDVDMTEAAALRERVKPRILAATGYKVTYTDIIVLMTAQALKKFPAVNASLVEGGIEYHNRVHVGIAVGKPEGLVVPVLKNADQMKLESIVSASKELIEKANKNKLKPDDMSGSTFTVSNLGMYGISHFNPIINQPNSAILGVSAIIDKVVAVNGEPCVRPMMTLSLTIDHRVVDGAPGAAFMQYLKQLLEDPYGLL